MAQFSGKTASVDWHSVWMCVRERLRRELGDPVFDAWIGPLTLEGIDKDVLRIGAAKPFVRNWVTNHYVTRIERAFTAEGVEPASLSIVVTIPPQENVVPIREPQSLPQAFRPVPHSYMPPQPEEISGAPKGLWTRMLHPQQTFESFIPGAVNEFSYSVARTFAEGKSSEFLLLFVHGGFGFGKTHLLNAAALEFRRREKKALFLRAEDFMRHFLGALHRKDTLSFKDELRSADVLIIDDLQHICRSVATASELLYTVNAFSDLRRKVIIAADRVPGALEGLAADLRSRIVGGLTVELRKPDRETRLEILRTRATDFVRQRPEVEMPIEILERLADNEDYSPREMIAMLTKLCTYADLTKKPVTMEMIDETIGMRTSPSTRTSIEDIQRKTAEFYKLDVKDFYSPQRARRVARPRQVAMYLARKLTTRSLPEIGRRFGGRDHTTVLHACRRIEALCSEDALFKQEVDFLSQMLAKHL
jgi:chromosomal replication initiator protein